MKLKLTSPNDFRNYLRMNEGIYEEFLYFLCPKIQKQDAQMCEAIFSNQRLSNVLRFLVTANYFYDLKFLIAISERTIGRIVMETCGEINKIFKI